MQGSSALHPFSVPELKNEKQRYLKKIRAIQRYLKIYGKIQKFHELHIGKE